METIASSSSLSKDEMNGLGSFLSSITGIEGDLFHLEGVEKSRYLEQRSYGGRTLLHLAVLFSNALAVRALLNLGSNVNTLDDKNEAPALCHRCCYCSISY